MAALQEMSVARLFSPDAISAKIQKYRQNKATVKIRQRNENGWLKIHKEMTNYLKDKQQNREFIPSYIEKDEYENKAAEKKMHEKLWKSENPLDGWNRIKERFVRKLHERLFKNDEEYSENAKKAIFAGYPFCPFERRVAFWITTENERFINEGIQGLCFCCFMNGVYHKAMSVKGTELFEKDVFTKRFKIFITGK